MAKKENLPKGIRYVNGTYEARKMIKGHQITLHGQDPIVLKEELDREVERYKSGVVASLSEMTLNAWFEHWLTKYKAKEVKDVSVIQMRKKYKRTFGAFIGGMKVRDILPDNMQCAIDAMEKANIAASTICDARGMLAQCFDVAQSNKMITSNPAVAVTVPKKYVSSEEEIALTEKEQKLFRNELNDNWYKELFNVMLETGIRVGEAGGLTWDDIDFKNKEIHIRKSYHTSYNDGVKTEQFTSTKTVNSVRDIPFHGDMEDMLLSQKEKVDMLKKSLGKRYRALGTEFENVVFVTSMGSPCNRNIVEREIKKIIKRINEEAALQAMAQGKYPQPAIRNFHPHTLRHTFATRCAEQGVDVKVAQKLLGHANISVTLTIYTHVSPEWKKSEINKLHNDGNEQKPLTNMSHY